MQLYGRRFAQPLLLPQPPPTITMADIYGTELYLLHLSTPEEFALVAAAKRGLKVYGS